MGQKNVYVLSLSKDKYKKILHQFAAGTSRSITKKKLKQRIMTARDLIHIVLDLPLRKTGLFKYRADMVGKRYDVKRWTKGIYERDTDGSIGTKFETQEGLTITLPTFTGTVNNGWGIVTGKRKLYVEWWMAKRS